jgi:hypothetical protein
MENDPLKQQCRAVLQALRTNGGAATPADAERICDAVPNGHVAMMSLLERGEVVSDQYSHLRLRERAKLVVDGHAVRL